MSDQKNTCDKCKWSDPHIKREGHTQLFDCCRHAPSVPVPYGYQGDESFTDRWPVVSDGEFCGEFEPKDGDQ